MRLEDVSHYKLSWSSNGQEFCPFPDIQFDTYISAYHRAKDLNVGDKRYVQIHKHDPSGEVTYIVTFRRGMPDSRALSEIVELENKLPIPELELALKEASDLISTNFKIIKTWEKKNYAIVAANSKHLESQKKLHYFVVETSESIASGYTERHRYIEKKVGKFFVLGPLPSFSG